MITVLHEPDCPCCGADGSRLENGAQPGGIGRRELLRAGFGLAAMGGMASTLPLTSGRPASAATTTKYDLRWPAPRIVARSQWGANERTRGGPATFDSVVEKLIVHHTATPNSSRHAPATLVRNVYTYHLSRSYIDLAYNFVIDASGVIYEGRWASNYPPGVVHAGENSKRQQVRGAHSLYHNDRTIGIALLGTFDTAVPSAAMVNSLVDLLTWKCARWNINPIGSTKYTDARGQRKVLSNIIGHRDVRQTLCPGDAVRAVMPSIRTRVQAKLDAGARSYWVIAKDGTVFANGAAAPMPAAAVSGGVAHATGVSGGKGFWLLSPRGRVIAAGGARHFGDAAKLNLRRPTVGMASSATGRGYFLVASDGGVFTFGDAKFKGSMGGKPLHAAMAAIAATPSGKGYWMLARDGGVFSFGDAKFSGSAWPCSPSDPAVALLATQSGKGYWIAQRSGKLHRFGDATATRFVAAPTAPLVALRHGSKNGGLLGLTSDGNFVRTPSAPALPSMTRRLRGLTAVAAIGSV